MADDSSESVLSWDIPPLPVISFDLKDSQPATFSNIKPFIESQYGEDGNSYNEEIKQMDQLRTKAVKPSCDHSGISVLRRYSGQLCLLKARLTCEGDLSSLPIDFRWKDVYSGTAYQAEGFNLEQASVLYNMGALHSQLGARESRASDQEMKEACTHFQCAAGAFAYLLDNFGANYCKDMSPELVQMYKTLMLAQAQECLIEKSTKGEQRPKPGVVAKLASKVSEMFSYVTTVLESEAGLVAAKKHKDWVKLCQVKSQFYIAVSRFFQAESCAENGRFGEKIAYLQSVCQQMKEMTKMVKGLPEPMKQGVKYFQEYAQSRLKAATQLNENVYHDLIPGIDGLEPVQPVELVKPVVFKPTDPSCVGTDIFGRLVPMRAYEAASLYSEEKAKLLRSVTLSVEEADEILTQYMQSLKIEELWDVSKGPPPLPGVIVGHHKMMAKKNTQVLKTDLVEMLDLQNKVTKGLSTLEKHKQESADVGGEGEESVALKDILSSCWRDLERNTGLHQNAANSNLELKQLFDKHHQNFVTLQGSLAAIQASVPTITLMDSPEISGSDSERLSEVLGKVDEMKTQRKNLLLTLRNNMSQDDLIKPLIAETESSQESLFDEHMQKHKDLVAILRQNIAAQENILTALTEINAKHVHVREAVVDVTARQEDMFQSLMTAGETYPVIEEKVKEGLTFYRRLESNVAKLLKKVEDVLKQHRLLTGEVEPDDGPVNQQSEIETGQPVQPTGVAGVPPPRPPKRDEFRGGPVDGQLNTLPSSPPAPSQPTQNMSDVSLLMGMTSSLPQTSLHADVFSPGPSGGDLGSGVLTSRSEFPNPGGSLQTSVDSTCPSAPTSSEQIMDTLGSLSWSTSGVGVPGDQSLPLSSVKSPLASVDFTLDDITNPKSEFGEMGTHSGMQHLQFQPQSLHHKLDESTGEEIGPPSASTTLIVPTAVSSTDVSESSVFTAEPVPPVPVVGLPVMPNITSDTASLEPSDLRSDLASVHSSSRMSSDSLQPDMSSMSWVQPPPSTEPQPSQFQPPSSQMEVPPLQFQPTSLQTELPPSSETKLPPSQFQLPSSQLEPPPSQFQLPSSQTEPPPSHFQPPSSETERPPSQFQPPSSETEPPPSQFQLPSSQTEPPPSHFQPPPSQGNESTTTSSGLLPTSLASEGSVHLLGQRPTQSSVDQARTFNQGLQPQHQQKEQFSESVIRPDVVQPPAAPSIDQTLQKQYDLFQKQSSQMSEQKRIIESLHHQLQQQSKDKAESSSNYQGILSLLQQQQPMIQQQQTYIHQLQEQNELHRRKVHEQQMKYEQRIAQEVLARERLQNQFSQFLEESQRKQKALSEELQDVRKCFETAEKDHAAKEKEWLETKASMEHFLQQRTQESQQLQSRLQEAMSQSHHTQQYVQQCQNELQDRVRTIDTLQTQQQQHFTLEQQWNAKEQKYTQELKQLRERLGELQDADHKHKDEIRDLKNQIGDLSIQLKSGLVKATDDSYHGRQSPTPLPSTLNQVPSKSEGLNISQSSSLTPINSQPTTPSLLQSPQQLSTSQQQQQQQQPQQQLSTTQQQQQQPPQQQASLGNLQPVPAGQDLASLKGQSSLSGNQQSTQSQVHADQQTVQPLIPTGSQHSIQTQLPVSQPSFSLQTSMGQQHPQMGAPRGQPMSVPVGQQISVPGGQQMNVPGGQQMFQAQYPTIPQAFSNIQQPRPQQTGLQQTGLQQPGLQQGVQSSGSLGGQQPLSVLSQNPQLRPGIPSAQMQQYLAQQPSALRPQAGAHMGLQPQGFNQPGVARQFQPSMVPPGLIDSSVQVTSPMLNPLIPTPGPKPQSALPKAYTPSLATKPVMTPVVTQAHGQPGSMSGQTLFANPGAVAVRTMSPTSVGPSMQQLPSQVGMGPYQHPQHLSGVAGLQPSNQFPGQLQGGPRMRPSN